MDFEDNGKLFLRVGGGVLQCGYSAHVEVASGCLPRKLVLICFSKFKVSRPVLVVKFTRAQAISGQGHSL
jgi:hypothetical protein